MPNSFKRVLFYIIFIAFNFVCSDSAFANVSWDIEGVFIITFPVVAFVSIIPKAIFLFGLKKHKTIKGPTAWHCFVVFMFEILGMVVSLGLVSPLFERLNLNDLHKIYLYVFVCSLANFFPNLSLLKEERQQFIGRINSPIKIRNAAILTYIPLFIILLLGSFTATSN